MVGLERGVGGVDLSLKFVIPGFEFIADLADFISLGKGLVRVWGCETPIQSSSSRCRSRVYLEEGDSTREAIGNVYQRGFCYWYHVLCLCMASLATTNDSSRVKPRERIVCGVQLPDFISYRNHSLGTENLRVQ